MLSKKIKSLLDVPDYHLDETNLTPMANFWCVIEPILNIIQPDSICEIGAERGITSNKLAEYCAKREIELYIVDPKGVSLTNDYLESAQVFKERSEAFFQRKIPVDLYFIDGDHNYETVMLELQSAVDNHINRQPVFLLHDVSWPWAFRDIYYDVGRTEKPHANVNRGALVIEHEKLAESGFLILEDFSVASKSGGDKNGVLRSVEDFQKNSVHIIGLSGKYLLYTA